MLSRSIPRSCANLGLPGGRCATMERRTWQQMCACNMKPLRADRGSWAGDERRRADRWGYGTYGLSVIRFLMTRSSSLRIV